VLNVLPVEVGVVDDRPDDVRGLDALGAARADDELGAGVVASASRLGVARPARLRGRLVGVGGLGRPLGLAGRPAAPRRPWGLVGRLRGLGFAGALGSAAAASPSSTTAGASSGGEPAATGSAPFPATAGSSSAWRSARLWATPSDHGPIAVFACFSIASRSRCCFGVMSVMARPERPTRPVRPMRWT
jgi:hypothetical protein